MILILSTSKESMYTKLKLLHDYSREYGMKVNSEKTKFFDINGDGGNFEPFHVGEIYITYCTSYMYLGSSFMCDGSVSSAVKLHEEKKTRCATSLSLYNF